MPAPHTFDFRAFEPLKMKPNHVQTDTGTGVLNFGDGKKSGLGINGGFDEGGLRAARRFEGAGFAKCVLL